MQEQLLEYFREYAGQAVLISILINTIVAVLGILPSFFVTGANIAFFGFWSGMLVSMAGEIVGAAAAFYLYRKGLRQLSAVGLEKYPRIKRLLYSTGWEAFYLILALRILPFIPSGLVTFAGAMGRVSITVFLAASTLGKVPALFIESLAVYQALKISWRWEVMIQLALIVLLYNLWKIRQRRRK